MWHIAFPAFVLAAFMIMASFVVSDARQRDLEKSRATIAECSLQSLKYRSEQDVKFFELVRELIVIPYQNTDLRNELVQKLNSFQFTPPNKDQIADCYKIKGA